MNYVVFGGNQTITERKQRLICDKGGSGQKSLPSNIPIQRLIDTLAAILVDKLTLWSLPLGQCLGCLGLLRTSMSSIVQIFKWQQDSLNAKIPRFVFKVPISNHLKGHLQCSSVVLVAIKMQPQISGMQMFYRRGRSTNVLPPSPFFFYEM